jgi:holo-[acyl-carrier protein] synthase
VIENCFPPGVILSLSPYIRAMIVGTGFDLVTVDRFARFMVRRGEPGLARLFTPKEIAYCLAHANPTPFLAVRFAAKEAFYKAVGTGIGVAGGWKDVEVVRLASGRPLLMLHGKAAGLVHDLQVHTIHLSLTHTAETAGAFVVFEA